MVIQCFAGHYWTGLHVFLILICVPVLKNSKFFSTGTQKQFFKIFLAYKQCVVMSSSVEYILGFDNRVCIYIA